MEKSYQIRSLVTLPPAKHPSQYEAGWAPQLVWKFSENKKIISPRRESNHDRPARSVVTITPWP